MCAAALWLRCAEAFCFVGCGCVLRRACVEPLPPTRSLSYALESQRTRRHVPHRRLDQAADRRPPLPDHREGGAAVARAQASRARLQRLGPGGPARAADDVEGVGQAAPRRLPAAGDDGRDAELPEARDRHAVLPVEDDARAALERHPRGVRAAAGARRRAEGAAAGDVGAAVDRRQRHPPALRADAADLRDERHVRDGDDVAADRDGREDGARRGLDSRSRAATTTRGG